MTIDKDSDIEKLEQEARISRLWKKLKRDNKDWQMCANKDSDSDSYSNNEDYYNGNGYYDEEEEQADIKEYLNSLSSEELKIRDTRNAKLWE